MNEEASATRAARAVVIGLRQAMEECGVKPKDLSDRIGRDPSYLYRVLGKTDPGDKAGISVEVLDEYAQAMGLRADEVLALGFRAIEREEKEKTQKLIEEALRAESAEALAAHAVQLGLQSEVMSILAKRRERKSAG